MIDCRFLPNPHWVDELRPLTGPRRPGARLRARASRRPEFLERPRRPARPAAARLRERGQVLPHHRLRLHRWPHRSVAIAEELARRLRKPGLPPASSTGTSRMTPPGPPGVPLGDRRPTVSRPDLGAPSAAATAWRRPSGATRRYAGPSPPSSRSRRRRVEGRLRAAMPGCRRRATPPLPRARWPPPTTVTVIATGDGGGPLLAAFDYRFPGTDPEGLRVCTSPPRSRRLGPTRSWAHGRRGPRWQGSRRCRGPRGCTWSASSPPATQAPPAPKAVIDALASADQVVLGPGSRSTRRCSRPWRSTTC